ncbi:MAG: iron-containing alcohol dehydrogenase [Alphaproteobacteria bacterium]|jgi:maleylacetate reductase
MQQGIFNILPMDRVVYGLPTAEAVAGEVARLGAENVFLIVSETLATQTDEIDRVKAALGNRVAGTFSGIAQHVPRPAVIEAAAQARAAQADLICTIGGGSVTDAGKGMQICLAHDVTEAAQLDALHVRPKPDGGMDNPLLAKGGPTVRQIAVPTTLSGGEFNSMGGMTDLATHRKHAYGHPQLTPRVVILDPAIARHTPEWLWLSTGVRAFDHTVEALCSKAPNAYTDGTALHAMALLMQSLPACKADPSDIEARLTAFQGVWLSIAAVQAGTPMGASHAIGRALGGACGVAHGHTSCVLLPAVMRWNRPVNADQQARVAAAMGRPGEDAADAIEAFIASLGQPTRLSGVGIGPDRFDLIAEASMADRGIRDNPRPIGGPAEILEILELAA